MKIPKHVSGACAAATLVIVLWALGMAQTEAANIVVSPDVDIGVTPYTISFGGGAATYTFYADSGDTVAVSTSGDAWVDSFAFGTAPTPYQLGILIGADPQEEFSPFPTPTNILYSFSEDSIGLKFELPDGIHYGYVTVFGFGAEVVQYGYNDTPGAAIATGAAAPEPATWVMLIMGFVAVGALARIGARRARGDAWG